MPADTSTSPFDGPAGAARAPTPRGHDDAPDTAALFLRLAALANGAERDAVRAELVTAWLPMAHRIADRFRDRGELVEDLHQVAALGLIRAVDGFDPSRGAFECYAVPTITGEVKRHFRDRTWAMHVPRRVQNLRNKVRLARIHLMQVPGSREPTTADIAARTLLTEEEVTAGLEALDCYSTLSLDMALSKADDSPAFADTLAAADRSYDVIIDREAVKDGLRRLPARARAILYMRSFEDMTQARIAESLGISQMHVSRIISRSCARIRDEALNCPPPELPPRGDIRVDARACFLPAGGPPRSGAIRGSSEG
ncbi:SigB/SigF/SigG family RNA polymerase sigma factor [Streptomyces sp. NPDC015139]|uniref:SigB/SigF/SigG family RNA polymerase sigma factor n=1 Tax=Streptomyces sp. NPDC015139 TaxID=3364942 RepID=UPI0036FBEF6E